MWTNKRKQSKTFTEACIAIFGATLLCVARAGAYTVVTSTDPALEKQFLASTTYYFQATVSANPLASNTYAIKLLGPGQAKDLLGGPLTDCLSQGFSDGMDSERQSEMDSIKARQAVDASSQTCSGVVVDSTTAKDCQYVYGLILNDINQRWNTVYTSTGGVVAP